MPPKKQELPTMFQIEDTIVSLDILEKKFICNLHACLGACCVQGDSGAPLEQNELAVLTENYSIIKNFLNPDGIMAIEEQGVYVLDIEKEHTTPLVDKKHCAYVVFQNNTAFCGIEKAYEAGLINWRKPISCHLYPIRIKTYETFTAVNYDHWDICKPALVLGEKQGVPLFQFLKEPLIRRFGANWYLTLSEIAKQLSNSPK